MEGVPFLCPHFESCRRPWRGDGWWVTHCPGLPFLVEESETPLGSEAAHPHQAHMHCSLSSRFTDLGHHLQPPSLGEEVLRHSPHSVLDPSGQLDVSQWHPNDFLRIQPAGNRIHTRPLDPPQSHSLPEMFTSATPPPTITVIKGGMTRGTKETWHICLGLGIVSPPPPPSPSSGWASPNPLGMASSSCNSQRGERSTKVTSCQHKSILVHKKWSQASSGSLPSICHDISGTSPSGASPVVLPSKRPQN